MVRAVAMVLAGGRSRRWGSEKAVARVEGAPMIARAADALGRDGLRVAVNAPEASGAAEWARGRGLPVLADAPDLPDGPLTGVAAGLEWAAAQGAEVLVTAPCDTPHLPRDYVRRLLAGLGEAPAAYATTGRDAHPLCAAWRVELLPALREALRQGHPSVRGWLEGAGARAAPFPEARRFRNLNAAPRASGLATRVLDAGAAILLLLLSLVGVFALLFALTFGDGMTPEAQARRATQTVAAQVACALLAAAVVGAVMWLTRRADMRPR